MYVEKLFINVQNFFCSVPMWKLWKITPEVFHI